MREYVAVVLVKLNGEILIQHRDKNTFYNPLTWCAVGGEKTDPTAGDEEEAVRELYEETGIKIDPDDLEEIGQEKSYLVPEDGIPERRVFFRALYDGKQEIKVKEGLDIRFISPEILETLLISPGHEKFLRKAAGFFHRGSKERRG